MKVKTLQNLIGLALMLVLLVSCGGDQNGSTGPLGAGGAAQKAYVALCLSVWWIQRTVKCLWASFRTPF